MKWMTLISILALTSCYRISDQEEEDGEIRSLHLEDELNEDIDDALLENSYDFDANLEPSINDFDTEVHYYEFNEYWTDSSLKCISKMKDGVTINGAGACYARFPIECEWVDKGVIERGLNEGGFETFDSLMCEVGGNSAYDKYEFEKNEIGQISKVIHYEAWFEHYSYDEKTGEEKYWRDYTPDWEIGHVTTIEYTCESRLLETKNEEGELYYAIYDLYDGDVLVQQDITMYGDNFKVFYFQK